MSSPCPPGTTQIVSGVCFVTKWGTEGSGIGQFVLPTAIAIDSSGRVYIADTGNDRISQFNNVGFPTLSWGTKGPDNGEFSSPSSVAPLITGTVIQKDYAYVADSGNDRIELFLFQPEQDGAGSLRNSTIIK